MKSRCLYIAYLLLLLLVLVDFTLSVGEDGTTARPPKRTRPTRRERFDLAKHIRACYKETGLPKADAYKIARGSLERDDEKVQCFLKCVYLRTGVMNAEGVFDEEKLKRMLPKSVFPREKV